MEGHEKPKIGGVITDFASVKTRLSGLAMAGLVCTGGLTVVSTDGGD